MLLNPGGFSGNEVVKLFYGDFVMKFKSLKNAFVNLSLAMAFLAMTVAPIACSTSSLTSWFTSNNVSVATVAAVAADVAAVLAAVDEDTTNAQLLADVLAAVPSKYTTFFAAVITALEAAVEADEDASAATTDKDFVRPKSLTEIRAVRSKATTDSRKINTALLLYLQQQTEKIQDENK